MVHKVSGQKEPIIKLLRELQSEDGRKHNKLFFAEEKELVKRAFDYGGKVEGILLTDKFAASSESNELIARAADSGVESYYCTEGLLTKILNSKPTPECLAIVERKIADLEDILSQDCPLVQMVENGENQDNLGMLLRTTEAVGTTGVVLAGKTTEPFSRRVVRGSRGAVFNVPICIDINTKRSIALAREKGLQIVATSAQSDVLYTEPDYSKPTVIVVGNEHTGISNIVREEADVVVRIPMQGKINSLNIAVAASVALYEALRQRSIST